MSQLNYQEIVIPTIEQLRSSYITNFLLKNQVHVLCGGAASSGKSTNINNML